ncbi:MAG: hypothetical protein EXR69_10835 [Myxococcales bacterium]|nr:hypothetical protein [Myxococcales bacterium]
MRPFTIVFLVAAASGMFFSGFSTWDFVTHLDRDVHDVHCSFIPGVLESDSSASSGCHVTLMSPYSSVFRAAIWGGIPIALGGLAVFSFLLFRGLDLALNRREDDKRATTFLLLATLLPVLTSLGMGYLSMVQLGAACKLCIGIYISSVVAFGAAFGIRAQGVGEDMDGFGREFGLSFAEGVGFVLVPALLYAALAPDYSKYVGTCGTLLKPEDTNQVLLPIGQQVSGKTTIEVFDPLCPACKGFEGRLAASGMAGELKRSALMFPLDNTCNWMVSNTLHPGACMVSEAVLCADAKADNVIVWAFEHQDELRAAAAKNPDAAKDLVTGAFPELKACIGSPAVKSRLNKSLRFAVANQLPVLTPQLYVENTKLCDADTDLGLDYALSRLLSNGATKETP